MSELVVFCADGLEDFAVMIENDTVWLTQAQMSDLFQRERTVITKHLRNIFNEGELQESVVCANFAHTTAYNRTT